MEGRSAEGTEEEEKEKEEEEGEEERSSPARERLSAGDRKGNQVPLLQEYK